MRRIVFATLAVLAAGGAWWLREQSSTTSFASYSDSQLDTLEAGYRGVIRTPSPPGSGDLSRRDAPLDAELSLQVLEKERARRTALRALAMVSLLAVVGALLSGRRGARRGPGEESRLRQAVGDPAVLLEGERHKAARLLGVTLEAPPAVVDAALAARLAAHDLGRLEGIAPEVRRMVLDQQRELQRARDLLVGGSSGRGAAPQQ